MANDSANREVTVCHPNGLHLRPAHALVKMAAEFDATIEIVRVADGKKADIQKGILGVIELAAVEGTQLIICATGNDAEQAVQKISEWFARRFTENNDGTKTEHSETDGQKII